VLEAAPSTYQARINSGTSTSCSGSTGGDLELPKAIEIRPDSALAYYDMYLAQSDSFKLKEATESPRQGARASTRRTNRWLTSGSGKAAARR
jgi:hypothetical protein